MNPHLNMFRFFNENNEKESIENNLSRAFSICLANNSLFLSEYIKAIVTSQDFEYLFSSIDEDTKFLLDLQKDTAQIDKENISKVYAVAMTSDKSLSMDGFFSQSESGEKNITDIYISIKDIAIIIEVKRTGEDCKAQLFNQAKPFVTGKPIPVIPISCSWQKIVKLMEKTKHLQHLISQNTVFINDFLQLSETRFPEWFEPKPFNNLPFSSQYGKSEYIQLDKRMQQAIIGLTKSNYTLSDYSDRLGISVQFGWASEIILEFQTRGDKKDYVAFCIYPGNTKQQGYQIFDKPLDWTNKKTLVINGEVYELEIMYNIKFCHFNGYVSGINFSEENVLKPLHTPDNFKNNSGKWQRKQWGDFKKLMDEHFKPEFDWRKECEWQNKFENTDRNYFTMSLGYNVRVYVPYSHFRAIDKKDNDIVAVAKCINDVADAFKILIN